MVHTTDTRAQKVVSYTSARETQFYLTLNYQKFSILKRRFIVKILLCKCKVSICASGCAMCLPTLQTLKGEGLF